MYSSSLTVTNSRLQLLLCGSVSCLSKWIPWKSQRHQGVLISSMMMWTPCGARAHVSLFTLSPLNLEPPWKEGLTPLPPTQGGKVTYRRMQAESDRGLHCAPTSFPPCPGALSSLESVSLGRNTRALCHLGDSGGGRGLRGSKPALFIRPQCAGERTRVQPMSVTAAWLLPVTVATAPCSL